jgi:hypothetical protein
VSTIGPASVRGVLAVFAVLAVVVCAPSCAVTVDGSFGPLPFSPDGTAVAILDENDVLVRDGTVLPVALHRAQKKVHLWLSSERLDPAEDWKTMNGARLAELRTRLALSDLLVVEGLDYDALGDLDDLSARDDAGRTSGDFRFALAHRALDAGDLARIGNGLGGRIDVRARAERLDDGDPRGGALRITLGIERARAAGQPAGDLVTGEVTLTVDVPFAPERLAEANLAVVAPIARCAAAAGPLASGICADEPSLPVVDGGGVH